MPKLTTIGPLGIEHANPAGGWGNAFGKDERADLLRVISGAFEALDQFAGQTTGSAYFSLFCPVTGSPVDLQPGGTHASSGIMGMEYNRAQDRVITEVVTYAAASGSNPLAVVRCDVQVQNAAADSRYSSIFSNSVFKPAYSGSTGFGVAASKTFVSGSNQVWPRGTIMKVICDQQSGVQAALGQMSGYTVQVFWKPSSSWAV